MDTTSYVGVYLLLKNKVFGWLGELFINSYGVKKGLVLCSSRCYKEPLCAPYGRKTFLIKTSDLLYIPRCQDDHRWVAWIASKSDLNIRLLEPNRRHRWQPATAFKF